MYKASNLFMYWIKEALTLLRSWVHSITNTKAKKKRRKTEDRLTIKYTNYVYVIDLVFQIISFDIFSMV